MRIRPVNDEQIMQELYEKTREWGSKRKLADKIDMDVSHLRSMISGNQALHPKVAAALGYELRWVKKAGISDPTSKKQLA